MNDNSIHLKGDVAKIQQIPILQTMLNVICQTTGMGFAAIARVTEDNWITCSVIDNINFGLRPGDELNVKDTICDEIRGSKQLVVFDDAWDDPLYKIHPVPAMYGIRSYISVPILNKDGDFFGTLCAIDPEPHVINNDAVIGLFTLFSELISFHLNAVEAINAGASLQDQILSQAQELKVSRENLMKSDKQLSESNLQLKDRDNSIEKLNDEISEFSFISSHDLQEPLRKMQMFSKLVYEQESQKLSEKGKYYLLRINSAAERMQSLVTDLLTFDVNSDSKHQFIMSDIGEIINEVVNEIAAEIESKNGRIVVKGTCQIRIIPFQMRQAIYNLLSNSLKFAKESEPLRVLVSCFFATGAAHGIPQLVQDARYCCISVADNGIGFDPQFSKKIFEIFERLEDNKFIKGTGIGLAIVKKVIDNHKGFIATEGEENNGATFKIYIPE